MNHYNFNEFYVSTIPMIMFYFNFLKGFRKTSHKIKDLELAFCLSKKTKKVLRTKTFRDSTKDYLNTAGHTIMLITDNVGVHDTGCGIERIDRWVDTQFCDTSRQHSCGVQMGESGGRGRIC